MFGFLIAGFLLSTPCFAREVELNGDSNIYKYAVKAFEEVKARETGDSKDALHYPPIVIQRASSVCYDELGCFDKDGTFKHLKQLPEPPETVNTKFLLYTRKNLLTPQFIDYKNPDTILNSNINPKVPLKFITHGFGGKNNLTWVMDLKSAFLEKEDVNVIVIDWSLGARVPYYIQAVVNTELVGAEAAVLFYYIKDHLGIQEKDLHVIGFSLGAHVAGFVGKRMQEQRETKPGRITGLDPASPLFEDYGGEVHLYKDDGDYVDVVHTNADYLIYGGVGISKSIGHVDFYPNGGRRQPGCKSTIKGALKDLFGNEREKACNHERAVHLFTDSILNETPCEYTSYRCSNYSDFQQGLCLSCEDQCGQMGYRSHGSGTYYLMTKRRAPFCAKLVKMVVKYSPIVTRSYGSMILTLFDKSGKKENITLTTKNDEKLVPGKDIVIVMPVTEMFKKLDHIEALYIRYKGLITKGKKTFGLSSVTIQEPEGNFIYKSCNDPGVILKHEEYYPLRQTERNC